MAQTRPHSRHGWTTRRHQRLTALAVVAVGGATLGGVLGYQSLTTDSPPAAAAATPRPHATSTTGTTSSGGAKADGPKAGGAKAGLHPGRGGTADDTREPAPAGADESEGESDSGYVSVFDDHAATVANLDPALHAALLRAATDAEKAGISFVVDSGWRSAADQAELLKDAVRQYGSEQEAEKWVATPETSEHVKGDAVDLGPVAARSWLARHGAAYGLCQVYANESWHYELRPDAAHDGCPAMYADPTHDPRMQQ